MIRLHPRLQDPDTVRRLAAVWQRRRSIRLAPLMAPEDAQRVHAAISEESFSLFAPEPGAFRFQFWVRSFTPEDDALSPVLAAFGRWLLSDVVALCAAITGQPLAPAGDRKLLSALYSRGCYLDPHNDADGARRVAYIVGLTPESWPASEGGHLEFLSVAQDAVTVIERRPPGWNTLDLFDVFEQQPLHQVPPLLTDRARRVFAGWFYGGSS